MAVFGLSGGQGNDPGRLRRVGAPVPPRHAMRSISLVALRAPQPQPLDQGKGPLLRGRLLLVLRHGPRLRHLPCQFSADRLGRVRAGVAEELPPEFGRRLLVAGADCLAERRDVLELAVDEGDLVEEPRDDLAGDVVERGERSVRSDDPTLLIEAVCEERLERPPPWRGPRTRGRRGRGTGCSGCRRCSR